MGACGGAHHWARQQQTLGYRVKLIAQQFVKPKVKSNKNDAKDTEAICEAMSRPGMRFVTVKSTPQQDIQATPTPAAYSRMAHTRPCERHLPKTID